MLFVLVIQRLKGLDDIERLLRWLALAAVAMAVLGLVQFLVGNGKFLWVYEHPSRTTRGMVKGTFANENHYAQFLALGIGPLVWWVQAAFQQRAGSESFRFPEAFRQRNSEEIRRLALAVALGVVAFAALMSLSSGGVVVLAVASLSSVVLFAKSSLLSRKLLCVLAPVAPAGGCGSGDLRIRAAGDTAQPSAISLGGGVERKPGQERNLGGQHQGDPPLLGGGVRYWQPPRNLPHLLP